MAKKRGLKCPWCFQSVPSINGFRNHIRMKHPHESRREDTAPLPNKLLSNRSNIDDSDGVFEFDGVLADDEFASCVEIVADSDDDSYYSDCGFENEMGGGGIYSSSESDRRLGKYKRLCSAQRSHCLGRSWSINLFVSLTYVRVLGKNK